MQRLFFALWPSESLRESIDQLNQSIHMDGVRKLKPQNLHLTLLYLGVLAPEIQANITSQVDRLMNQQFKFELDGLAYWQAPRILCLTVNQQPCAMHQLVDQLVEIVKEFPIYLHDRPYRAHVTLMRKAKQHYDMQFSSIAWQANSFVLVASESTPTGIKYTVLQEWALQNH